MAKLHEGKNISHYHPSIRAFQGED